MTRIGLHDLRESHRLVSLSRRAGVSKERKNAYPHQEEAIRRDCLVSARLDHEGAAHGLWQRKDVHVTCIAEDLLVQAAGYYISFQSGPDVAAVREWSAHARFSLRAYAVCSDAQVGRRRRQTMTHYMDLCT